MNERKADSFFQHPRTIVQTSAGAVELPVICSDASVVTALFRVDHGRARAMIAEQGLEAVPFAGSRALVGVSFYEYRDTSIAAYHEVGVAIAAAPRGTPTPRWPLLSLFRPAEKLPIGFFIVDLPVTTRLAWAVGREIWGYPKFVTPIGFALKGSRFDGTVTDPANGKSMVRMSGKAGPGAPAPLPDLALYSRHDGRLLRTLVTTRGGARACLPGSLHLTVSDSAHPMAQRMRALGLADARPMIAFRSHALQLRLNTGTAVREA